MKVVVTTLVVQKPSKTTKVVTTNKIANGQLDMQSFAVTIQVCC